MTKQHEAIFSGLALALAAGLLLQACSRPGPPAEQIVEAPADSLPADSLPAFVNRVWKVSRSAGVEKGQLYTFLGDGTLLIASFHGTPSLGRWTYRRDTLTLVEEGLPHPATVLRLEADTFSIRIHGPAAPLDITFTPGAAP